MSKFFKIWFRNFYLNTRPPKNDLQMFNEKLVKSSKLVPRQKRDSLEFINQKEEGD